MRLLLLMASCFSLVLAGAFFSHQEAFSASAHQHVHVVVPDEPDDHSHATSTQTQQVPDEDQLHCGTKILALVDWAEHPRLSKNSDLPVGKWVTKHAVWAVLDPPPPRHVPKPV